MTMGHGPLSRRDILLGASAAGLVALAGCSGDDAASTPSAPTLSPSTQPYDVIVVGAGPAGIAAARTVQSFNRSLLVLEAMNRIGGRVYTDFTLPIPFDPGAQFMGQVASINTNLYPIAQQLGIPTKAAESVPQTFYNPTTGTEADPTPFLTTYGLADTALLSAGFAITTLGEPDQSALQVFTEAGLHNAPYIDLAAQFLIAVIGGTASTQSVEDLYNFLQFSPAPFVFPRNDSLYMPSGFGAFLARLATGLPVQWQSPVQSITYGGSLVTLTTTTGQTYQAKTVIVTASTAVLASGSIAFSPALPPAYVAALADLPLGHAYKIMLGFTSNPFNGRLGTQPGKMRNCVPLVNASTPAFSVNYFAEEYPNAGIFMVVTAEDRDADAYEAMGPTNAARAILQLAEAPFPGVTAAWNGQALASSWGTNPYTRGCYSFATPGKTAARVQLAQPLGKQVWFAGEALSIRAHSLVHGAWASGTAAAYGALASIGVLGG